MGGNQLQIFNGILLKVAAVTIEPEEPGGGAIARAASGGIMGQCSAVIEAASWVHLEGHLQVVQWAPKLISWTHQSLGMDSMRTMPYLICFQ